MLTESVLLGVLGGALGVLAAAWSLGFVVALIPANTLTHIPGNAAAIHLDLHTLAVAVLASVATGLLFGLARLSAVPRKGSRASVSGDAKHLYRAAAQFLASHARRGAGDPLGDLADRRRPYDSELLASAKTSTRLRGR